MIDAKTRERARQVFERFVALPVAPDGSIHIPLDLRQAMIDLALDVLVMTEGSAKSTLAMLTTLTRPR